MSDELVKRLRGWRGYHQANLSVEAADRIEALKAHYEILWETNLRIGIERDRLKKALEDIIADCEADYPPSHGAIKYAAKLALKGEAK